MGRRVGIIKNIAYFCIFLVLILVLSLVFKPKDNWLEAGVHERDAGVSAIFGEPEDTIDVVVLGDSESFTSVSPLQLWDEHGFTSYVCGQSGQEVIEAYYWLKQIFEEQSPKVIILETNMLYRYESFEKELDEGIQTALGHYVPFYKYHDRWKNLNKEDLSFRYLDSRRDMLKGFEIKKDIKPYTGGAYMKKTNEQEEVPGVVKFYMSLIKRLCEKNRAKIQLLSVPSPVNWNYERHNGVEEYAREQGFLYLDMNLHTEQMGIDWEQDTMDQGDHMNIYGAKKVNRYLGKYLLENYELPDHRKEESHSLWNLNLKDYENALGQLERTAE